jgi:hypothetical protein
MSFHHAERFTLAEVIGFAGGRVFVGLDVNDMAMIVSFTGVMRVRWLSLSEPTT